MSVKQMRGGLRNWSTDAKEAFGALGKIIAIFVASGTLLASTAGTASATDMFVTLRSPSFGGTNVTPYQYEQAVKTLRADRAAAAKAAATASTTTTKDENQVFADAIVSQLNSLVARDIALKIADSKPGDAGTIQSGSVSITFINADGQLNIVITTPTGVTNLSLPTAD